MTAVLFFLVALGSAAASTVFFTRAMDLCEAYWVEERQRGRIALGASLAWGVASVIFGVAFVVQVL